MSHESDNAPPVSRTTYVVERLKNDVANGIIKPGELIKQTVLASRYGVSATPVREALRMLESDGVVTYSAHKGASVREMTPATARDLYRLRAATESVAAQMGVERMTPDGLERVLIAHRNIVDALDNESVPPADLSLLNKKFHFSIYAMSSPIVLQHIELLWGRFTPGSTVWRNPESAADLQRDHDLILTAVQKGDAVEAGRLTAAHIDHASHIREHEPDLRAVGTDEKQEFPKELS